MVLQTTHIIAETSEDLDTDSKRAKTLDVYELSASYLVRAGALNVTKQANFGGGINITGGGIIVTGGIVMPSGVLTLPNGTAAAPSLSFANSATTGFYSAAANNITTGTNTSFATSGTGTITAANGLTVTAGGATVTGNSTVTGTLGVTGNTTIGGTLGVTGASTLGGLFALTIPANVTFNNAGETTLSPTTPVNVVATMTNADTTRFVMPTGAVNGQVCYFMLLGEGTTGALTYSPANTTATLAPQAGMVPGLHMFVYNGSVWVGA